MEVLEAYLNSFVGPIICISHDRFFLDKVCDTVLYYEDKHILSYQGTFSEFLDANIKKEAVEEVKKEEIKVKEKVAFSYKEKFELEQLEKKIPEMEKEIEKLNKEIEDAGDNYSLIGEVSKKLDKLNEEYEISSLRYMELLEKKGE